ncbi:MAG: UDP-galactopyranose mutase [Mycoplasma sp.]
MKNNKKKIIIGAGVTGCSLANIFAKKGYVVEIYERNSHIGGICYDSCNDKGILIHNYGPHIFHTDKKEIWDFLNQFGEFNGYINKVLVEIDNKLVQMPINFNSIKDLNSEEDFEIFKNEVTSIFNEEAVSIFDLRTQLSNPISIRIVNHIYKNIYENYTIKMWGIEANDIDPNVLKRVKINLNYNWNYFPYDPYQGLPVDGYTVLLQNMINHSNIKLNLNYDALKSLTFNDDHILFNGEEVDIIFTGPIDSLFNFKFGSLSYRSLDIKFETINKTHFQEIAVINYPAHPSITRICEYKYLTKQNINDWTTISYETPGAYDPNSAKFNIPYYPINNEINNKMLKLYNAEVDKLTNLHLIGRLAHFKYYDMDDAIEQALLFANKY